MVSDVALIPAFYPVGAWPIKVPDFPWDRVHSSWFLGDPTRTGSPWSGTARWINFPLIWAPTAVSMTVYLTLPRTRALAPSSTRSLASMSPLTTPFKMTLGATTEPSMQPFSLTDKNVPWFASPLTLPLIWPSRCRPPMNSTSPSIRVLGPIRVSTVAFLLCFCLNICLTLGRIPASLGFHRHSLRLPNEGLPKTVAQVSVFAAVNLDPDARRLETLRQLNGFVVILKVTEGVCQADTPVRRHLAKSQA